MNNFRGFLVDVSREASSEPYFNGSEFSVKEKVVPTSVNYKVDDLLAIGKVSPVSTEILHDNDAVDTLVNSDGESADNSDVESVNE